MKRNNKREVKEDSGYYIILFLCVVAIGISGYVMFFTESPTAGGALDPIAYAEDDDTLEGSVNIKDISDEDTQNVINSPEPLEENIPVQQDPPQTEEVSASDENPEPIETNVPDLPEEEPVVSVVATDEDTEKVLFVLPTDNAETIKVFSDEELQYDVTMEDWRVHLGTDFKADTGSRVYAISSGTVEDIYESELYGRCVTIFHKNDLITSYYGLSEDIKVEIGDTVIAGDVIAILDGNIESESVQGPHLHVEAIQNGSHIDVMKLFD